MAQYDRALYVKPHKRHYANSAAVMAQYLWAKPKHHGPPRIHFGFGMDRSCALLCGHDVFRPYRPRPNPRCCPRRWCSRSLCS